MDQHGDDRQKNGEKGLCFLLLERDNIGKICLDVIYMNDIDWKLGVRLKRFISENSYLFGFYARALLFTFGRVGSCMSLHDL